MPLSSSRERMAVDLQLGARWEVLDVALELARAEQEAQLHRFTVLARAATGVGGDALRHQLDADPGRQAAVRRG